MPNITINISADGVAQAAALVPIVQAYEPSANLAYVYSHAAAFGLKRIVSVAVNRFLDASDLAPVISVGTTSLMFDLDATSTTIATAKATDVGLTTEEIVSAAMCTGLALLIGTSPGPSVGGLSRQFLPPVEP